MVIIFYLFVGILIVLISLIIGWCQYRKNTQSRQKETFSPLKATGRIVKVDLSNCEIKTNEYYENVEQSSMPSRTEMIDALYGSNKAGKSVKREVSVILFKHQANDGRIITYRSNAIYLQADMIKYYMMQKKETDLYVDPENETRYYFDIDFLK